MDDLGDLNLQPVGDDMMNSILGGGGNQPRRRKGRKAAPKPDLSLEQLLAAPVSTIFEVRVKQSEILKEAGNSFVAQSDPDGAIQLYKRGLVHCDFEKASMSFEMTSEHKTSLRLSVDKLNLNLARCSIKVGKYRDAVDYASKVSGDSADCKKAFFLIGKGWLMLKEYQKVLDVLSKVDMYLESVDKAEAASVTGNEVDGAGSATGEEDTREAVDNANKHFEHEYEHKLEQERQYITEVNQLMVLAQEGLKRDARDVKEQWKGKMLSPTDANWSTHKGNACTDTGTDSATDSGTDSGTSAAHTVIEACNTSTTQAAGTKSVLFWICLLCFLVLLAVVLFMSLLNLLDK